MTRILVVEDELAVADVIEMHVEVRLQPRLRATRLMEEHVRLGVVHEATRSPLLDHAQDEGVVHSLV